MSKPIKRAMVLAAGLGLRMRPVSEARPKPLVTVAGRTLLDHVLDRLIDAGIECVVVNIHYRPDMIREVLARRSEVEIRISDETDKLLDTGGGIAKALHYFEGEAFLTHNADSLWTDGMGNTLAHMGRRFDEAQMDALMLVAPTVSALGYFGRGDFVMNEEGLLARREEACVAPFVWAGVQIVHPRLFDDCPKGPFSTNVVWNRAIERGRLYGTRHDGVWMHVGCPEGLRQAEAFLANR
jgi:MurNAc alpha-1-phosphate uridylyltransferase